MTAAALVGIGFGLGVALIASGMRPLPMPLDQALADLRRTDRGLPMPVAPEGGLVSRLLGPVALDTTWGQRMALSVRADLRITGKSAADYLSARIAFAAVAALWAPLAFGVMRAGGVDLGFVLPLWVSLALA